MTKWACLQEDAATQAPQSLTLAESLFANRDEHHLLDGDLCQCGHGMFQLRVLEKAFFFPRSFLVIDITALRLPDHWTSQITWLVTVCVEAVLWELTQLDVAACSLRPRDSVGSASIRASHVLSPCCWAGIYFLGHSSIFSSWKRWLSIMHINGVVS